MSGSANSKLEALEELRKNFERFKATKLGLPRPGTKVPVEFASNERVSQHSQLAKDFVNRVLDIDWAWVSDKSSLWDFHGDETNKSLTEKIRHIYGVDVSDISAETSQTFSTGFQSIGLFRERLVNSVAGQMVLCAHLTQPIQTESLKTW